MQAAGEVMPLAALASPIPVDPGEVDSDQGGKGGEEHEQGFHRDLRLGPK
jgi:hypothetical protein